MRTGAGKANLGAAGIALAYCVLAVVQSFATGPGKGPDEQAHLIYVHSLARDGRIPAVDGLEHYAPGSSVSHQAQHPPLYYFLAAFVYRAAGVHSDSQGYLVLRLLSIVIGLGVLALQWRLAGLVFEEQHLRLAALAILAFLPMFTYEMAVANNDALAVLCFAGALCAMLRVGAGRSGRWAAVKIGLWIAAGTATKESALALLPVAVLALMLPREGLRLRSRLLQAAICFAIGLLPACAWWYHNLVVYHTPFKYAYVEPIFQSTLHALSKPGAAIYMLFLISAQTFGFLWSPWWDLAKHIPAEVYYSATGLLAAAGLIGLILYYLDTVKRRTPAAARPLPVGMLALLALLVCVGIVRYTLFVDYRALQGGRYLIVAWPALAILATLALAVLFGRRARTGLAVFCGLWAVFDALSVFLVGRTYSAW